MNTYKEIHLVQRPINGAIGPHLFEVIENELPSLQEGQFLIKQLYMSMDPAMLGWMMPDEDSYIPPVALHTRMRSSGYGEIVSSKHDKFKVGDKVMGMLGWSEYILSDGSGINNIDSSIDPKMALSVLALPGITAAHGFFNICQPQKDQTLFVTGAAGSVGSIVGQLAKANGVCVIGVVGSDDKADWIVNSLNFDGAINYKSQYLDDQVRALAPNGIDMFFENTGGPIQHFIFDNMNTHGRIAVCGMIADYLSESPDFGPNWIPLIKKRITIQGFAMPDHWGEIPILQSKLMPYVLQGDIKFRSHVLKGLESAMNALPLFFSGENKGKLMIEL
jgi:NADPH-dependent curcumin reductase CurA